jgi:hypothetical protein
MSDLSEEAPALSRAVLERTAERAHALLKLDRSALEEPSLLPDWSRLTIACHLRYGAAALKRMTKAALRGDPTAYYPDGRALQRPGTLVPRRGEGPVDVVASLAGESFWLDQAWRDLTVGQWATEGHLADDQRRPPLADDLEALRDGARHLVEADPSHGEHSTSSRCVKKLVASRNSLS